MCDPIEELRFEHIDTRDSDPMDTKPIIDAAWKAQEESCCAKRWNAISRAVFDTATELGFNVAWGDVLKRDTDPEAVHFYVWPKTTIHTHTVSRILEENNAYLISPRSFA